MFFQTVIQATMLRLRRWIPPPPLPGERRQGVDRSGFILGLVLVFTLLGLLLIYALPDR
ncbi:MAG: hypothetical protein QM527_07220 [Alphaproteobacteria bacterium]|nr:hypothetical protein [Alphaproteobacteria bacterium]